MLKSVTSKWQDIKNSPRYFDRKSRVLIGSKNFLLKLFQLIIIIGISYVILAPVIGIVSRSFFSDADQYNPSVFTIPLAPTLLRYEKAIKYMNFWQTMGNTLIYTCLMTVIQVCVCSMVGYGFARFNFPLKKLLFGFVVLMIVVPTYTIEVPLYMVFRNFPDPFGITSGLMKVFTGKATNNLMGTPAPVYVMSILGCGLRSGLYIYIFNQFFRGLPKEIEEAAFVDGAGTWYTYFRIMLVNAMPAVITVTVFSLVWQYNDTFMANLFNVPADVLLSRKLSTLQATVSNGEKLNDPNIARLYCDAGVVLVMIPVVLMYLALQRRFIEGVERSGIVG